MYKIIIALRVRGGVDFPALTMGWFESFGVVELKLLPKGVVS